MPLDFVKLHKEHMEIESFNDILNPEENSILEKRVLLKEHIKKIFPLIEKMGFSDIRKCFSQKIVNTKHFIDLCDKLDRYIKGNTDQKDLEYFRLMIFNFYLEKSLPLLETYENTIAELQEEVKRLNNLNHLFD